MRGPRRESLPHAWGSWTGLLGRQVHVAAGEEAEGGRKETRESLTDSCGVPAVRVDIHGRLCGCVTVCKSVCTGLLVACMGVNCVNCVIVGMVTCQCTHVSVNVLYSCGCDLGRPCQGSDI